MYWRLLQQSFHRQRRRKLLALGAVMAGMTAATTLLMLRTNLGDDLNAELRQIGANIVVNPAADSLPVVLNGLDLRPAAAGALLNEADLPRLETIFWANNLAAFAPVLDTPATMSRQLASATSRADARSVRGLSKLPPTGATRQKVVRHAGAPVMVEGTYFAHTITAPGRGRTITTGVRRLDPAWQVVGHWPNDDSQGVLAGVRLARSLHLAPGQIITVQPPAGSPAPPLTLTVTGILSTGAAEDGELVAPLAIAQALADQPGKLRQVRIAAVTKPDDALAGENPATMSAAELERWSCSPYAASIAAQVQQALPGSTAAVIRPVAESEGPILHQLNLLIWLMVILALASSGLAISAVTAAAVLERRREVALMKALGAHDSAMASLLLGEAVAIGACGGVVGFGLGQWLAIGIGARVTGHALVGKPVLAPLVLLLAMLVTMAGSWVPLRRALRLDPALALQGGR